MDYHDTSAGIATLAVIKYTTVEPGKSKGSIFVNPGVLPQDTGITTFVDLGKVVLVVLELLLSLFLVNH
jgi:hypothetical protein